MKFVSTNNQKQLYSDSFLVAAVYSAKFHGPAYHLPPFFLYVGHIYCYFTHEDRPVVCSTALGYWFNRCRFYRWKIMAGSVTWLGKVRHHIVISSYEKGEKSMKMKSSSISGKELCYAPSTPI